MYNLMKTINLLGYSLQKYKPYLVIEKTKTNSHLFCSYYLKKCPKMFRTINRKFIEDKIFSVHK